MVQNFILMRNMSRIRTLKICASECPCILLKRKVMPARKRGVSEQRAQLKFSVAPPMIWLRVAHRATLISENSHHAKTALAILTDWECAHHVQADRLKQSIYQSCHP